MRSRTIISSVEIAEPVQSVVKRAPPNELGSIPAILHTLAERDFDGGFIL